jgi:hypothetical protein
MGRIPGRLVIRSSGRPAQSTNAVVRELGKLAQLLREDRCAHRGQPLWPVAIDGRQGLDQMALLETGERGM